MTEHRPAIGRSSGAFCAVGIAFDKEGALLVADDVGSIIWRVTPGS